MDEKRASGGDAAAGLSEMALRRLRRNFAAAGGVPAGGDAPVSRLWRSGASFMSDAVLEDDGERGVVR